MNEAINEVLDLVKLAFEGKDNLMKGSVGFNGYGFIFKYPFQLDFSFISIKSSRKFCNLGAF